MDKNICGSGGWSIVDVCGTRGAKHSGIRKIRDIHEELQMKPISQIKEETLQSVFFVQSRANHN